MSTAGAAGGRPSRARTAKLLAAQFVGFAALLFVTRFIARAHLIPLQDQECHIGGIAIDVLAHGIRFPLLAYAPNEYDNGSFFSGVLAALSFSLLGRNVLALKLVTHLVCAAGAVAMLWLLRGCLDELGLTNRRVRAVATTALVIAIALAPRVVTFFSLYAVGNHAEGSAIDTILLALFSRRLHTRSPTRTAAFWALVGFALYLNKGTVLVIPVLAAVEVVLAWRAPGRLLAGCGGFILGLLPELGVIATQLRAGWGYLGWMTMVSKEQRNSQAFPHAFFDTLQFIGEYRIELLAVWALAMAVGVALLVRSGIRYRREGRRGSPASRPAGTAAAPPVTLAIVVGVAWMHLAALAVMAKPGLDAYVIYGYPTVVVLFALLVASTCRSVTARGGDGAGAWIGAAAVAASLVLYRPDALTLGFAKVSALGHNRAGAACSWRFAEGFEREVDYRLGPPGQTREQYAIERCRSLSEDVQVLDCIGGIARELVWRQRNGKVNGEPPAGLSAEERRAYAYQYGTHRKGNVTACGDFDSPGLRATCAAAVELECLHYADLYTQLASGLALARPRCAVPEVPMDGYWAEIRSDLLSRTGGTAPKMTRAWGDDDLSACKPIFDACY